MWQNGVNVVKWLLMCGEWVDCVGNGVIVGEWRIVGKVGVNGVVGVFVGVNVGGMGSI
jgi:hypothetical protein